MTIQTKLKQPSAITEATASTSSTICFFRGANGRSSSKPFASRFTFFAGCFSLKFKIVGTLHVLY